MKLTELKCPTCGAKLVPESVNAKIIMCSYCGTVVYLEEERKVVYVDGVSQKERGETELALISLHSANYQDAKVKFEQAISNNVGNNVAWFGKAAADVHLGRLGESQLAFKKAISLGSPAEMVISWGNYLMDTARYYQYSMYSRANAYRGNPAASPNEINRLYQLSQEYGKYRDVINGEMYAYLLSTAKSNTIDENILGYVLQLSLNQKDYANAYALADKLLSREPASKVGLYYKGVAALYLGQPEVSISSLTPLLESLPNNYNVYIYLAYAYYRAGNRDYALDLLLTACGRYGNRAVFDALSSLYKEWYKDDKRGAKSWKSSRKKDIKRYRVQL
ncbi:MAG: hypothetical protein GXO25_00195 [Euryarchaeota archaeon]|nr:hypothetical protein [Euryarchaeota archaeon]